MQPSIQQIVGYLFGMALIRILFGIAKKFGRESKNLIKTYLIGSVVGLVITFVIYYIFSLVFNGGIEIPQDWQLAIIIWVSLFVGPILYGIYQGNEDKQINHNS
jgi:hypothetical protein